MAKTAITVRQENIDTIRWALCAARASTIRDLSQETGLSFATVRTILNGLVESGEAVPGDICPSAGGRPSRAYQFHADHAHLLAVSARVRDGQNMICACVGNLYGETVWKTERQFEHIDLAAVEAVADVCVRAYPTIRVLSFSLPGVEHGGMILTNDYKELEGIPFAGHFESKYRLPVRIENDVNVAVLGCGGSAGKEDVLAGVYFPRYYPPGAGIMVDGKILKGSNGYAGEIALLPLDIDWLAVDYENPLEIGPVIAKLLLAICSVINPGSVILYGDFFSDALLDFIRQSELPPGACGLRPTLTCRSDLDSDILSGLLSLSLETYRESLCKQHF